jgi:hypothetical protein
VLNWKLPTYTNRLLVAYKEYLVKVWVIIFKDRDQFILCKIHMGYIVRSLDGHMNGHGPKYYATKNYIKSEIYSFSY